MRTRNSFFFFLFVFCGGDASSLTPQLQRQLGNNDGLRMALPAVPPKKMDSTRPTVPTLHSPNEMVLWRRPPDHPKLNWGKRLNMVEELSTQYVLTRRCSQTQEKNGSQPVHYCVHYPAAVELHTNNTTPKVTTRLPGNLHASSFLPTCMGGTWALEGDNA